MNFIDMSPQSVFMSDDQIHPDEYALNFNHSDHSEEEYQQQLQIDQPHPSNSNKASKRRRPRHREPLPEHPRLLALLKKAKVEAAKEIDAAAQQKNSRKKPTKPQIPPKGIEKKKMINKRSAEICRKRWDIYTAYLENEIKQEEAQTNQYINQCFLITEDLVRIMQRIRQLESKISSSPSVSNLPQSNSHLNHHIFDQNLITKDIFSDPFESCHSKTPNSPSQMIQTSSLNYHQHTIQGEILQPLQYIEIDHSVAPIVDESAQEKEGFQKPDSELISIGDEDNVSWVTGCGTWEDQQDKKIDLVQQKAWFSSPVSSNGEDPDVPFTDCLGPSIRECITAA